MSKQQSEKRVLFDLNHPADFHFFEPLLGRLKKEGYELRIVARDKEMLQDLLRFAGWDFIDRGKGKHSLPGKYLYGFRILLQLFFVLLRYRPVITISLSSPYLALVTRIMGISCITYDDTDQNPRLRPLIRQSTYLFTPLSYPSIKHRAHFKLPTFKELAYLKPTDYRDDEARKGVFVRLTRTDSIHHSSESTLNTRKVLDFLEDIGLEHPLTLSSEISLPDMPGENIRYADILDIHKDLSSCKVFWGNSATMAAEAAVLGIPAIFVSAEKFTYITELENYGLLFHYYPRQTEESLLHLKALLEDYPQKIMARCRHHMLKEKINFSAFLYCFMEDPGKQAILLRDNPEPLLQPFIVEN